MDPYIHNHVMPGQSNSSDESAPDIETSFRKTHQKSRGGCKVCKVRRVKCDEGKPSCSRCISTGRTCEGYPENISKPKKTKGQPSSLNDQNSVTIYQPATDIAGSPGERRSFHYFRTRNMSCLPGNFEPYFWDHIVLQLSQQYPTIRHSLVAFGAMYEDHEQQEQQPSFTNSEHALRQYNKAVRSLLDYLASDQQDMHVGLVSCLIFVWIELLQGNLDTGFQHLNSGLKILRDLRRRQQKKGFEGRNYQEDVEDIYGSLDRSFTRLRVQAALHGSRTSDFTTSATRDLEVIDTIPDSFVDYYASRTALDDELNAIFGYVRHLRDLDHYTSLDMAAMNEIRIAHLARLERWRTAHESMVRKLPESEAQPLKVEYLRMYYLVLHTILKTMFAQTEMVFDEYEHEFDEIIRIADRSIGCGTSAILSFDMGIILPMFYIALKCRNLSLRQKAIAVLEKAPAREGLWRRDNTVVYSRWKVKMEEEGRGYLLPTDILPESARICQEQVVGRGDNRSISFRRGALEGSQFETVELSPDMLALRDMGNMI